MKLYKKAIGNTGDGIEPINEPVIICTIEELREVWDDAEARGFNQAKFGHGNIPDFKTYLQSKGINNI